MSNIAKKYMVFYAAGLWNKKMLWNVVDKPVGGITPEEYKEITGEDYTSNK